MVRDIRGIPRNKIPTFEASIIIHCCVKIILRSIFGRDVRLTVCPFVYFALVLCQNDASWSHKISVVKSCKVYIEIYIMKSRSFKCCLSNHRKAFYRSANAVFGKVGRVASEEVTLQLINRKCIPSLLYGLEACPLVKYSFL